MLFPEYLQAKPFLKWAGGKTQLIEDIRKSLPPQFYSNKNITYVEPFVGSGAVLFWLLQNFSNVSNAIINDINPDLSNAYSVIKHTPELLIESLHFIQNEYYRLKNEEAKREYFLNKRQQYNENKLSKIEKTTILIFLNRTCFNGLYRVNSKGYFNVPFGKYDRPKICDPQTILADSKILERVEILQGDYSETVKTLKGENVFFYLDPPYKPLNETASFNSYSNELFGDQEQERLRGFCKELDMLGYSWLLSNSDLKNENPKDEYFDLLYSDFNISRVKAKRMINSNSSKRGEIFELLISNYTPKNQNKILV